MKQWVCVNTKKGMELTALIHLNAQYDDRAFCPMMKSDKRENKKHETEPLWPAYIFLQLDDETDDWSKVRSTKGVNSGLVRRGLHYPTVPDEFIDSLKGYVHGELIDYEKGNQIRILSGPFEDFIADVEKADKETVSAWITIFNDNIEVSFERAQIESVNS